MQKQREKAWGILSRDPSTADVMNSRHNSLSTLYPQLQRSYRTKTSPREEVSPTCKHIRVPSITAEGWLWYKQCNSKHSCRFTLQDDCITAGYIHTCHSAAFWSRAFTPLHPLSV